MGSTGRSRLAHRGGKVTVREFTIDDPTTYTEPWGGQVPMLALDDLLYEYACHEGNYALSNVLQGARYEERMNAQEQDQTTQR